MLTVNKELKAQAMEKAAEDGAADEAGQGPAQARGHGRGLGGAEGPAGRPALKRSLKAPGGSGPLDAPAPNTSAAEGGSQDAMIQLKVDPAKLPKAEDLKALMFPGTMAVVVDDTSIRLVSRESFPTVVIGLGMGVAFASGFVPAFNAAWARALAAAGVPPGQTAPTPCAEQPPSRGTTANRGHSAGTNGRSPRVRARRPARWRRSPRMIAIPP